MSLVKLQHYLQQNWWLVIILLALLVRLGGLSQFPPQLNRDEAALAINARFINQAGRDEWGVSYPIQFKSFGDFKLPGYIYTLSLIFTIAENDTMVRLPAALAGWGVVILGWWIYRHWFPDESDSIYSKIHLLLFLAFTPFAVFYSRMAWEAMLGLFLFVFGVWALWPERKNRSLPHIVVGLVSMGLSMFTYNAPLIMAPFVVAILIYEYLHHQKKIWPAIVLFFLWIAIALLLVPTSAQKSNITIFQDPSVLNEYPVYRQQFSGVMQTVLGNKYLYFGQIILQNSLKSISPEFLVVEGGGHPWHSILGRGHIYWTIYFGFILEIVLFIRSLLKTKFNRTNFPEISIWLFFGISLIPSVITTDAPHATRSLMFLFLFTLLACRGWVRFILLLSKNLKIKQQVIYYLVYLIFIIEALDYGYSYFFKWGPIFSPALQIGLSDHIERLAPETDTIVIEDDSGFLYPVVAWEDHTNYQEFSQTVQRTQPNIVNLVGVTGFSNYVLTDNPDNYPQAKYTIRWDENDSKWDIDFN